MKLQMVLCASLLACGGKDDAGPADKSFKKAVDGDDKPASTDRFGEFGSNAEQLQKWQGAWVLESGALGRYEAWEVKGNQVTSWDGKKEQTRELVIDSPCEGRLVEKTKDGGSSSTAVGFVFVGDKLYTGMGDAGIKKGDKILACGSGKTFVWDGKACVAHANNFGRWETKPAECKLENGEFVTKRPDFDMKSTFKIEGDVLLDDQMKRNKVEKATSFADAKTKLETFKK